MLAADLDPFLPQQIAQHPAAHERKFQVQFVDAPHDCQISHRNRSGQVIDAVPADPQFRTCRASGKLCERSIIALRSATDRPSRACRPKNRSPASTRQSCVQRLPVNRRPTRAMPCPNQTHRPRPPQLATPRRDLVRMHVKLLHQLGQRLLALHGSQCHLRLESPMWFRRGRVLVSAPVSQSYWPSGRKSTYLNGQFCQATSLARTRSKWLRQCLSFTKKRICLQTRMI